MELLDITIYYLEMREHFRRTIPQPRTGLHVRHIQSPTVSFYREIYNAIGEPYRWLSRRKLSDEALAAIINDPLDEVHVLFVDETPAGLAELDRRAAGEVELVQFGLIPDYIGQGLGKWFLQQAIDQAWSYAPTRFWLHTCTLDHEGALPLYQQAGFQIFKQEQIRREY